MFWARNGLRGCLRVVSCEETCRRHVTWEIFSFTVGVYVMNTLSKWAYFGSQEGCPEARSAEGLEASARAPASVLANHPEGQVLTCRGFSSILNGYF